MAISTVEHVCGGGGGVRKNEVVVYVLKWTKFQGMLNYKKNKFQNNTLGFTQVMFKTNIEQSVPWVHLGKKPIERGLEGNSASE